MYRSIVKICALAALGSLGFAAPASANLILNGSFETGDLTDWTLTHGTGTGNTAAYATDLDFVQPSTGNPYVPEQGTYFMMMGDNLGNGANISQKISDGVGSVLLTFWVATDGFSTGDSFSVLWDGTTVAGSTLTNDNNTKYVEYQFALKSTGSDTLEFLAQNSGGFWLLDNVDVEVPEPGTLALLGSGLFAAAGMGWRRRRATKTSERA